MIKAPLPIPSPRSVNFNYKNNSKQSDQKQINHSLSNRTITLAEELT